MNKDREKNKTESFFTAPKALGVLFVFLLIFLFGFVLNSEMERFVALVQEHAFFGAVVYVLVLASGVIFVPFSSTPVSIISEPIWGLPIATLLSGGAWWLGAMSMFFLARYLGRSFFERFFSFERSKTIENAFVGNPFRAFFVVLLAHMVIPVEIPSFAAGVSRKVSSWVYAPASLLGIMVMAFVIVGLGGSLLALEWREIGFFLGLFFVVLVGGRVIWKRYLGKE